MKIALIYPRFTGCREGSFGIGGYSRMMFGYPPLSLAYTGSIIRNAGHQVAIIDGNILNLGLRELVQKIKNFSPDLIGFSINTGTFHNVLAWIREIKNNLNIPVIVGGALMDLYPAQVMQHPEIDYAVSGDGIDTIPEFLSAFGDNAKSLEDVPGLSFRLQGKTLIGHPQIRKLERLPFPARDLLPNHRYFSPFSSKKNFTALLTSAGCRLRCAYCCLPSELQLRKNSEVMAELKECYYKFKIRDIDFYDSIFTADRQRTIELCQEMRKDGLDFSWSARTNINFIDKELIEEMAASGCRMIMYGIESTDQSVLKNLNRPGQDEKKLKEIIQTTKKFGILCFGFFMLGLPDETKESIKNNLNFSRKSGFDFVQFSKLTVIPGTKLYEDYLRSGSDPWADYISGNRDNLPEIGGKDSCSALRQVKKANLGFYFNFLRIIRIILSLKSFRQFYNQSKAGLSMFFSYFFREL